MGLLRPATPLSVIFLVAFVLLLLSTLSTPVISAIPLGTFQGYNFGVFGWCKGSKCSGYKIGYSTDGLFTGNTNDDFEVPASTRHSLSAILIVHPIAALLALVCFGLACAAHFHKPSHSPRYLLALLILTIPTLLVTLLAFLVDILLFVPHMQWGTWIVLAATILIIASSVVTCAMRRTLVSRKARKKRIAENADMSGENYYNGLNNQNRLMADELPKAESPPPLSGSTAADKGMPQYAAFEMKRHDTPSREGAVDSAVMDGGRRSMDDRTPLNPTRDPSIRSASTGGAGRRPYGYGNDAPPMPMGRPSMDSNRMESPRRPSRDQYGNAILPAAAVGAAGMAVAHDLPPPGLRHETSQGSLGSNRSNGNPPRGGRGGYGPPGRGYGPPRGGYGPPGRGSYGPGPRGGYRGQQPPPPGWRGGRGGYGGPPPPGVMMGRGGMPRQQGPPPGYAGPGGDPYYTNSRTAPSQPSADQQMQDPYYGNARTATGPTMADPSPPAQAALHHDEFIAGPIGPIGQAIEMDERTGSPPGQLQHEPMSPTYGLRDSDGDVAGMVGLQQERGGPIRQDSERTESVYSDQTYQPPRAQWQQQPGPLHQQQHPDADIVSPLDSNSSYPLSSHAMPSSNALPLSPIQASPTSPQRAPLHHRGGSESYYEDVDPRFAIDPASEVGAAGHDQAGPLPSALTPGGHYGYRMQSPNHLNVPPPSSSNIPSYVSGSASGGNTDNSNSTPSLERNSQGLSEGGPDHSFESLPEGARSPGEGSEASHFTSVSQRGINPNWRPGPGSAYGNSNMGAPPSSASAAQRRREDVILNANPDFSLPGMGPAGRSFPGGRGRGGPGGGMMRGGPVGPTAMGLTPSGRYPTDI